MALGDVFHYRCSPNCVGTPTYHDLSTCMAFAPLVGPCADRNHRELRGALNEIQRRAGANGCPEGAVIVDWLRNQRLASRADAQRNDLLRRALPILADAFPTHPEVEKLCAEIRAALPSDNSFASAKVTTSPAPLTTKTFDGIHRVRRAFGFDD